MTAVSYTHLDVYKRQAVLCEPIAHHVEHRGLVAVVVCCVAVAVIYPVVLRPAYTLGGSGGGIAHNQMELEEIPYETEETKTSSMYVGRTKTVQEGCLLYTSRCV